MSPITGETAVTASHIANGHHPAAEHLNLLVTEAYQRFRARAAGTPFQVYPRSRPPIPTGSASAWPTPIGVNTPGRSFSSVAVMRPR